jgi:hypothetical protein
MKYFVVLLSVACLTLIGCASHVALDSNPPGAQVFYQDELMGVTPVSFKMRCPWFSEKSVSLQLEGYTSHDVTFAHGDQQASVPVLMPNVLATLFMGVVWTISKAYDVNHCSRTDIEVDMATGNERTFVFTAEQAEAQADQADWNRRAAAIRTGLSAP